LIAAPSTQSPGVSAFDTEEYDNDVGAFLAVFAALLLDNALRLDETVGRVTDFVMASKPNRDLVVTLQSFDRLKQEFERSARR